VPRKRSGESYFPSFLEPHKRSEKALLGVVMEAYVNGVSTRKVDHLVSELGIQMSKDQVSRICRELDAQVEAFRTRPLEGAYPYLWLDAKHLKVRDGGHVHSKALTVAFAVHESGRREVIGIEIAESETEAGWAAFLRELVARGLEGVRLAVSLMTISASRPRSPRCSAAPGSLHRALHPKHARPLQEGPAQHGLRRPARGLQRRGSRRRQGALGVCHRETRPDGARRWHPCSKRPRRTCWPSTASRRRTGQSCAPPTTTSSASTRRSHAAQTSSHLPQRRLGDPPGRSALDRAKR
jgi:hypothetical protein